MTPPPSRRFGRYAPSPSGRLHIGNLRTALIAWLIARSTDRGFLLRFEDLDPDRTRSGIARQQAADLALLGIDWDAQPQHQSNRTGHYEAAVERLSAIGATYECWCTRSELAAAAPHDPQRPYPGTCRELTAPERRLKAATAERPPALRVRLGSQQVEWDDMVLGPSSGVASDPVIRRADGVHAYNLAVIVDDAEQGVDQVVRGDDLAGVVPMQAALSDALGLERPTWAHVPLVLNRDGGRLAKREGSTTLAGWAADGTALARLGASLGLCSASDGSISAAELLERFTLASLPRTPWMLD